MRVRARLLATIAAIAASAAAVASARRDYVPTPLTPPPPSLARLARLELVTRALDQPVDLVAPDDGSGRLFVVEKTGRVRVLRGGRIEREPLVDIHQRVSRGAEQGLLGLALHPGFTRNGRFFLSFTDRRGDSHVVERRVTDGAFERELVFVRQPYANHNGGHIAFGPDGRLYLGLGDGGSANDPHGNGQNRAALLGKMLRIDVDAATASVEITLVGLRNPWRFSFDRRTGDLYIADVGQDRWEEVDVLPAGQQSNRNLGWNTMEGTHCLRGSSCSGVGLVLPVVEYDHGNGCSITGGAVYRGKALPELDGVYFYADYCTALLRSFRWQNGRAVDEWDWKAALDPDFQLATVTAIAEDHGGELHVLSLDGSLWRLIRR